MSKCNKSGAAAYLLWFFLGGFGAHRFYMGRTGSAFGMMGLCIASMVLSAFVIGLIGFPVLFVWWVIDAFKINKWLQEPCSTGEAVVGSVPEAPAHEQEQEPQPEQEAA
ncbi:MAG: TM2 domain-containing protein [Planctomycetota bacterium]|jgi:TM2 domain-containing membrane protein YozV